MMGLEEAYRILKESEEIFSAETVTSVVKRMSLEISTALSESYPLVLSVMGGAVVFTGQLLPQLNFPLDFDYLHVSRYGNKTTGGSLTWKVSPGESMKGRVVLVLDDILDEGETMAAIREKVMACGASEFFSAVFADKKIDKAKPIKADFIGMTVPNRYIFGFGMDIRGAWRNLPAIYALKEN